MVGFFILDVDDSPFLSDNTSCIRVHLLRQSSRDRRRNNEETSSRSRPGPIKERLALGGRDAM
jgi:hypothetical protein